MSQNLFYNKIKQFKNTLLTSIEKDFYLTKKELEINFKKELDLAFKNQKKFSGVFKKVFYKRMLMPGHHKNPIRNRADNFLKIFRILEKKKRFYNIVETGCMRSDHGVFAFGDDGASTLIFDLFVNFYNGSVFSVDINKKNVFHAKKLVSNKTKIYKMDSVKFLWNLPKKFPIDLLYLDSFDLDLNNPHPSSLHHIKELCAVIKNLNNTIIVVDDHKVSSNQISSKGAYVKDFMLNIGAKLLFENYQIGFRL